MYDFHSPCLAPRRPRRGAILLGCLLFTCLPTAGAAEAGPSPGVERVLERYGGKVDARLRPRFRFADVAWPPREAFLVALKDERRLELWARDERDGWRLIRDYRIKGMSGGAGPKLRRGDRQVPEGLYGIEALNPNSAFHLSMKIDYPNARDREQARREGRNDLGGDIFIHGKEASEGCIAIGDNAIEELFVLAGLIGRENVAVLIAPRDFRQRPPAGGEGRQPAWVVERNGGIAASLMEFQRP